MTTCHPLTALLLAAALTGCTRDDGIAPIFGQSLAVVAGDFDDITRTFERQVVAHDVYEGIISTPTYDPDWNFQAVALKVEDLLGSGSEMRAHSAIFVSSGTRGLGDRQYNALEPDDHLVSSPEVIDNTRLYVENNPYALVATDWAYDLIEATWPNKIDFLFDDTLYDDAQRGEIGRLTADIVDPGLAEALGVDEMGLRFNYSNWAVIEEVSDDVTVFLRGTVQYRPDAETVETLTDVPLMVGFQPERTGGNVIFTSFHIDAQNELLMDKIIEAVVGTFEPAEGESVAIE